MVGLSGRRTKDGGEKPDVYRLAILNPMAIAIWMRPSLKKGGDDMRSSRGAIGTGSGLWRIIAAFAVWGGARAAEYYVSPEGRDTDPGTEQSPWQTIAKASATMTAGDTVRIMRGTYCERVSPGHSGLPGKPITYTAYPGHSVVIDGTGVALAKRGGILGLVDIGNKKHIRISGLSIVNTAGANDAGIFAASCEDLILEKNRIANTGASGILTYRCSKVIIDGNWVQNVCARGGQESISLMYTDTFEVRSNYVHSTLPSLAGKRGGLYRKEGIDAKDGSSHGRIVGNHVHRTSLGIYVDARGTARDIEISGNTIHDIFSSFEEPGGQGTGNGIVIASETAGVIENIRIFNNVIRNTHFGIRLAGYGSPGHPVMTNLTVTHNTLYRTRRGIELSSRNAAGIVIRNNLCSRCDEFDIGIFRNSWGDQPRMVLDDPAVRVERNLLDVPAGAGRPWERDNVYGAAGFVAPDAGDFRLRADSAARDRGAAAGTPPVDITGNPRPSGAAPDIGAYEFTDLGAGAEPVNPAPTGMRRDR